MVDFIKPSELPPASTVYDDDAIVVDNAGLVQKATPEQVVNAGAPVASQAEAIAGTDNTKRMTALRVKQVLDNVTAPSVLRAQAWAEASGEPDPAIPGSKSSKSWAERSEAAAAQAALYDGIRKKNIVTLLGDTAINYTDAPAGTVIQTKSEMFAFETVVLGSGDYDISTDGGVLLRALRGPDGTLNALALGIGVDFTADVGEALQKFLDKKGRLYLPAGTYKSSIPLVIRADTHLFGDGETSTIIHKYEESEDENSGIDAVLQCYNTTRRFTVEGLSALGNRTDYAEGNTVTTHGFYLWGANNFTLRNVTARSCLKGFVYHSAWIGLIERATAQTCQDYGHSTQGSCTSLHFANPASWGCKGGMDIVNTVYSTVYNLACDQADCGKSPDDPFLPHGSGGDYQNPGYIFRVISSRVSFINCGCESGYSQYFYGEGAFVDMVNPYAVLMKCAATTWYGVSLRQSGASNVRISNPRFNFSNTLTAGATRAMWRIDDPRVQRIQMDQMPVLDASFGEYNTPVDGMVFEASDRVINITPSNMVVGQDGPFVGGVGEFTNTVVLSSGAKRLQVAGVGADNRIARCPIPNRGDLILRLKGSHTSSSDFFRIRVVGFDGTNTDELLSFTVTSTFDVRKNLRLDTTAALTSKPLYIELRAPSPSDTTLFEYFVAEIVG